MPKSKRDKVVPLSKIKKSKEGREAKEDAVQKTRGLIKEFNKIFVIHPHNLSTPALQTIREAWKPHSRFLMGKTSLMQLAFGKDTETEVEDNLHFLGKEIKGQAILLFTNQDTENVVEYCSSYSSSSFASPGDIPSDTITLDAGKEALEGYSGSLEAQLRKQGMSTILLNGEIHLAKPFTLADENKALTPEQCKIQVREQQLQRMLGYKLSKFTLEVVAMWERPDKFKKF